MATLTETLNLSPRISFSHDIDIDIDIGLSNPSPGAAPATSESANDDFDFRVSLDALSVHDPSPADRLFSHGVLLPLNNPLLPHTPHHHHHHLPSPITPPVHSPSSSSFWKNSSIGRSSSVGAAASSFGSKLSSICPYPRSKSTGGSGSHPKTSTHLQGQQQAAALVNSRSTHVNYRSYSAGSGRRRGGSYAAAAAGVRNISPVINVGPTHFIPRGGSGSGSGSRSTSTGSSTGGGGGGGGGGRSVNSVFAYLMCNCRDKNGKELVCGGEI